MKKHYDTFILGFAISLLLNTYIKTDIYSNLGSWLFIFIFSVLLVHFKQLTHQIVNPTAFWILKITVWFWIGRMVVLFLTTLVSGGGLTFAIAYLLAYLNIPLKLMGFFGLLFTFIPKHQSQD